MICISKVGAWNRAWRDGRVYLGDEGNADEAEHQVARDGEYHGVASPHGSLSLHLLE